MSQPELQQPSDVTTLSCTEDMFENFTPGSFSIPQQKPWDILGMSQTKYEDTDMMQVLLDGVNDFTGVANSHASFMLIRKSRYKDHIPLVQRLGDLVFVCSCVHSGAAYLITQLQPEAHYKLLTLSHDFYFVFTAYRSSTGRIYLHGVNCTVDPRRTSTVGVLYTERFALFDAFVLGARYSLASSTHGLPLSRIVSDSSVYPRLLAQISSEYAAQSLETEDADIRLAEAIRQVPACGN